jgi:hypothetical protein
MTLAIADAEAIFRSPLRETAKLSPLMAGATSQKAVLIGPRQLWEGLRAHSSGSSTSAELT